MSAYRLPIIASILVLAGPIAWSETISLPLTDDTWIHAASADINYGNTGSMLVSSWGRKRPLVRFDAAALSGQPVSRATLKLYLSNVRTNGDITVHAVTSSWFESSATWNAQPPTETSAAAMVSLSRSDIGTVVSVDVTDVAKRWASGSLPDAGLLIKTALGLEAYFTTKEGAASGVPAPELEVQTGPAESMVDRIPVLDGYRVLGDPPYSTSWQTEIEIDQSVLLSAKSAHIGLYTIHNALGRLVINGEVVQLPYAELNNQYGRWRPELGQTLISIPLGYLRSGENTIRVESGIGNWTTENVYDDFEFGDVEIILSRR